MAVCSRCIYDDRVGSITFDQDGICKYCHQVDSLIEAYGTGRPEGQASFDAILDQIRRRGKGRAYDCVIGVSGGTDSSYLCHMARKEWGLRPLAVHYDNTWNSAIATQNIRKVLGALDINLVTHVVDNRESDDIFRSFFRSGVAEIEAATDLGYAELLRRVAAKYKVKFVLEGHSFVEEGITPLGRNYFDGQYIRTIHREYGNRPMKTYPLMTFSRFLWWSMVLRIQMVRPFWYLNYVKTEAQEMLSRLYDWEYYGGHHLENRMTAFLHGVYLPQKFNSDMRNNTLAAQVRNGHLGRDEGIRIYKEPPVVEWGLEEYFCKRLGLSQEEYLQVMGSEPRNWYEFKTYKKRFERLRPWFHLLAKRNLVPMSFYLKYCFPRKHES